MLNLAINLIQGISRPSLITVERKESYILCYYCTMSFRDREAFLLRRTISTHTENSLVQ